MSAMQAQAFALAPIVQIHPTLRCNLRCLHCYSESGPDTREANSAETIISALDSCRRLGFDVASFSGGEPILCDDLGVMLRHAKSLGMRTTVTSNGTLLSAARLKGLAPHIDVLAISLDGKPSTHDRMRNCKGAFARMARNLDTVRNAGVDFGFIFTLTLHNVDELGWAAEFAASEGAKLFQVHPLEEVGRAADALSGKRPDAVESAFAYLECERVRGLYGDRLFVQLDLFHRDLVAQHPDRFHAERPALERERFSEHVAPIVIEADGTVSPISYGFGRRYAIGSLRESSLDELALRWMSDVYPAFRALCQKVHAEACKPSPLPFFNWYEQLQHASFETSEASALN